MEWIPQRVNERAPFMQGLHDFAGPRAVEEFIAAVTATQGERMGGELQRWWDDARTESES
jgi:hypothetical protein